MRKREDEKDLPLTHKSIQYVKRQAKRVQSQDGFLRQMADTAEGTGTDARRKKRGTEGGGVSGVV